MTNILNNELQTKSNTWTDTEWIDFRNKLVEQLKFGTITVNFTKKDGNSRTMECTLNPTFLPPSILKEDVGNKKENTNTISVFDVNAKGWRSFIVKNIKEVNV
jgi:hypothetical protein